MTGRAAVFGAVLGALWAAHDVADHIVQTDEQAARKASSWSAMAGHVGSYHAAQTLVLLALRPLGVRPSWRRLTAAVALSAGTHALLDRRWPVLAILRGTGSARFAHPQIAVIGPMVDGYGRLTNESGIPREIAARGPLPLHGPYLADQALHHGALAICAAIIAGGAR